MKLIAINAWMGKLSPTLAKFVAKEKPDIICMQEAFNSPIDTPIPNHQIDVGPRVKQSAGLEYEFFSQLYTVDIAGLEVPFGNIIYSRYPIISQINHILSGEPFRHLSNDNDTGLGQAQTRSLQIVQLDLGESEKLVIANHHGYIARGTGERFGDEHSEAKMRQVAAILHEFADLPLILAGDLNVVSESQTMRVFDNFLRDLTTEYQVKSTLSPAHLFEEPTACDHVLVNDKISVHDFAVRQNAIVSDHLPLVLGFDVRNADRLDVK